MFTVFNFNSISYGLILLLLATIKNIKLTNGTIVTLANVDLRLHFVNSTITLTDMIIHAPNREEWKWDSPLLAKVGKLQVSFNFFSMIYTPTSLKAFFCLESRDSLKNTKHYSKFLDIYALQIEDVLIFIEKRQNICNFHLLDESLDIPDAKDTLAGMVRSNNFSERDPEVVASSQSDDSHFSAKENRHLEHEKQNSPLSSRHVRTPSTIRTEATANDIVTNVLDAVTSLGRAANEGGTKGLGHALENQKNGFVRCEAATKKNQNIM